MGIRVGTVTYSGAVGSRAAGRAEKNGRVARVDGRAVARPGAMGMGADPRALWGFYIENTTLGCGWNRGVLVPQVPAGIRRMVCG